LPFPAPPAYQSTPPARCRRFTHFTNAQRVKEAGKGGLFCGFQRVNHVLGRLWPHAIQTGQFTCRQPEEIRWRMDILFLNQLIDNLVAHAVNVHRPTGDEVLQRLFTLRATD
jgi:hypothetical protein